jgi:hypothetical protein
MLRSKAPACVCDYPHDFLPSSSAFCRFGLRGVWCRPRRVLGSTVIGGMIAASGIAIFLIRDVLRD